MARAGGGGQTAYTVYPVANYNFGTKAPKAEKDSSVQDRLVRMRQKYEREGCRRSVEAVLLVHEHRTLHVLLLQLGAAFFKLPGGRLRAGEEEVAGLRRKLESKLSPESARLAVGWEVGECCGCWWRPHWDTALYPYLPPHITRPKEVKKLFVCPLPERCLFAVPQNMRLVAVPLFELHDNVARYGPVVSALPLLLSRLRLNMTAAASVPPSLAPPHKQPQQNGEHYG